MVFIDSVVVIMDRVFIVSIPNIIYTQIGVVISRTYIVS